MSFDLGPDDKLITRQQAAEYLRRRGMTISYATLGKWASIKKNGPPYYKDGNRALYNPAELDAWWLKRRLRRVDMGLGGVDG